MENNLLLSKLRRLMMKVCDMDDLDLWNGYCEEWIDISSRISGITLKEGIPAPEKHILDDIRFASEEVRTWMELASHSS